MKKSTFAFFAVVGFFCLLIAHAAEQKAATPKLIYEAKCASCHGKDGKGNAALAKAMKLEPASLNLTAKEVQAKKNEELIAITTNGKGKMPAYKGKLSDADIKAMVEYIRSLGAPAEVKK